MVAGDLIRLAWEAEHDGRKKLRDTLLTLAVAESTPDDAWAERCRNRLILERPDHYFGKFATIALALEDSRVLEARDRLRQKFPASRIQWLLLKASAARGPYLGRVESLEAMLDDLAGPSVELENVRADAAQTSRGPIQRSKAPREMAFAIAYPSMTAEAEEYPVRSRRRTFAEWGETVAEPPVEDFSTYYLTVLLAIAFVLATVQEPSRPR